jgi:hypothetical protein
MNFMHTHKQTDRQTDRQREEGLHSVTGLSQGAVRVIVAGRDGTPTYDAVGLYKQHTAHNTFNYAVQFK